MEALAAYFSELRGRKSFAAVAAEMGVSEMSVRRIEEKGQEPKAEMLNKIVRALRARWEDVEALLSDKHAKAEDGRRLARILLEERARELADRVPETDRPDALQIVRSLRDSPEALRELRRLLRDSDGVQQP